MAVCRGLIPSQGIDGHKTHHRNDRQAAKPRGPLVKRRRIVAPRLCKGALSVNATCVVLALHRTRHLMKVSNIYGIEFYLWIRIITSPVRLRWLLWQTSRRLRERIFGPREGSEGTARDESRTREGQKAAHYPALTDRRGDFRREGRFMCVCLSGIYPHCKDGVFSLKYSVPSLYGTCTSVRGTGPAAESHQRHHHITREP